MGRGRVISDGVITGVVWGICVLSIYLSEGIAAMYKSRWAIESFFRWIELNLNVPVLFGTTSNALFNQLFTAIIAYALLKFLRAQGQKTK